MRYVEQKCSNTSAEIERSGNKETLVSKGSLAYHYGWCNNSFANQLRQNATLNTTCNFLEGIISYLVNNQREERHGHCIRGRDTSYRRARRHIFQIPSFRHQVKYFPAVRQQVHTFDDNVFRILSRFLRTLVNEKNKVIIRHPISRYTEVSSSSVGTPNGKKLVLFHCVCHRTRSDFASLDSWC